MYITEREIIIAILNMTGYISNIKNDGILKIEYRHTRFYE